MARVLEYPGLEYPSTLFALGVGHRFPVSGFIIPSAIATCVVRCVDFSTLLPLVFALIPVTPDFGVAHNPRSFPLVAGIDTASWNNKRPCGVAFGFQVK